MRSLPTAARLYICVLVAAAVGVFAFGSYGDISLTALVVLGLLFWACESIPALLNSGTGAVSVSVSAALAAVILVGPLGTAAVAAASALLTLRGSGLTPVKRVFNAAQFALCGWLAGITYEALGGHVGPLLPDDFPEVLLPFTAAVVVYNALNSVLLAGVLLLTRDDVPRSLRGVRWRQVSSMGATYLGYCAFALLIAALWQTIGWFSAVLVLLPLFVARWALAQYQRQQQAYDDTMRALIQAVETKDFYTRGHCMRVSKGSVLIAEQLGMRADRVDAIRYAGMMHDVGKLGVPTRVLQKSGPLTDEEYAAIQLHPMRGLDIVRDIGFLDEALAGILHHHERVDGRGYPMGLAGDEIPQFARIIGVADALDSMTSTRSYRGARSVPEAVGELRKWAGTQFDAQMVDALIKAIERFGWDPPRPVGPPGAGPPAAERDHDDPSRPLRVVRAQVDRAAG